MRYHMNDTLSTFFFFNDTATTEIFTLSLHDALPIWMTPYFFEVFAVANLVVIVVLLWPMRAPRSEEHTSELQSQSNIVCRLLLEKKKNNTSIIATYYV